MEQLSPDNGIHLRDLLTDEGFRQRASKAHDISKQTLAFRRLANTFGQAPHCILQELVNTAIDVCNADSAGLSLEEPENHAFRWVAVAGSFSQYLNSHADRDESPCGKCLDSGRPQLYRVTKPFYDSMGITAKPITDGVLIPWMSGSVNGTLWTVSHSAEEAFDREDFTILTYLAEIASAILLHQHQQRQILADDHALTMAKMANDMAHIINNPLQRLTNTIFLAKRDRNHADRYLQQAEEDLTILSKIVAATLRNPFEHKP
jgi:hypothetical protein